MGVNETKFDYETLRDRAASPWAARVGLLWGFAEATLFFIVPDVLLGAVALFAPRAAPRLLAFTLAGALVGFLARGWIARRPRAILVSYGALWLAVYVVYAVWVGV